MIKGVHDIDEGNSHALIPATPAEYQIIDPSLVHFNECELLVTIFMQLYQYIVLCATSGVLYHVDELASGVEHLYSVVVRMCDDTKCEVLSI